MQWRLQEKEENNGSIKLAPEQLALHMSIEFETTLEKVQDAVFRNNYVQKAHVTEAMQQLIDGKLSGGGPDGKITPAEAEAISGFVSRLGRMRWKVTGSRQPLIPTHQKAVRYRLLVLVCLFTYLLLNLFDVVVVDLLGLLTQMVKDEKPSVELAVVLKVMEELIPSLTVEMEAIAKKMLKGGAPEAERRAQISQEYIRRSGELTAQICAKYKVDLREFQQALIFYHDDADFEQVLARLSTEQQKK